MIIHLDGTRDIQMAAAQNFKTPIPTSVSLYFIYLMRSCPRVLVSRNLLYIAIAFPFQDRMMW